MKRTNLNRILEHERKHASYLIKNGSNEIWGWESAAGKLRAIRRAALFINKGIIVRDTRVLEVGCGTGTFTKELVKTKAHISAIDISPVLIKFAKKKVGENLIDFKVQDAMHTSFNSEVFDIVVGCSVLHHLIPELALKEFFRILKSGGRVVFSEPNMLNPQIAIQKNVPYLKRLAGDSPDETAFFSWRIKSLLKKVGFKEISIEPFDFLHPKTPKKIIKVIDGFGKFLEKVPLIKNIAGSLFIYAEK